MFILEVLIDNGSAWPHDKDRVKYGPFETRDSAQVFFNIGAQLPAGESRPVFDPDHCVITNLGSLLNDPSEGIGWAYKS